MSKFRPLADFAEPLGHGYGLLPLRFHRLNDGQVFVSNLVGEWEVLSERTFQRFANRSLKPSEADYLNLRAKHFLIDTDSSVAYDLLALKLRSRLLHLRNLFGLAIFVVTLRCEHSCPYCQVSRQSEDRQAFDMSFETAQRALDQLFGSPATGFKIEFQGGEPLLNFDLIKEIVESAEARAAQTKKNVAFVIATNLALISDDVLDFCRQHSILISTSLDGPADLHNKNRPRRGNDSHEKATQGIALAKQRLGEDRVSALMTTTKASLSRVKDIIDEYRKNGLHEVFLRPLSPYGFAIKTKTYRAYQRDEWLDFWREGLRYIIELNKAGEHFIELYAATVLRKMLTPTPGGYVDMMNPAGIGTQVLVFNYDGDVYASDEGRMLAEMGDKSFLLGNIHNDQLTDMILGDVITGAVEQTILESVPMCSDCAFQNYCGADPVFHHATQGDVVGHKPTSQFCQRQMAIFEELVALMQDDPETKIIFRSWVN
jgi:His-Xaa-Ser system radical SAM maturase HxsB